VLKSEGPTKTEIVILKFYLIQALRLKGKFLSPFGSRFKYTQILHLQFWPLLPLAKKCWQNNI